MTHQQGDALAHVREEDALVLCPNEDEAGGRRAGDWRRGSAPARWGRREVGDGWIRPSPARIWRKEAGGEVVMPMAELGGGVHGGG